MTKVLNKIVKFVFFIVFPVGFVAIFIISYFALRKLVYPSDIVLLNGKKLSEYAAQKRKEVLHRCGMTTVNFKAKDGVNLSGLLLKRKLAKANLLVCHGFQGCKEKLVDYFDIFTEYNILIFDFRAHGQSEGRFRTLGCHEYKDVIAASEFLHKDTMPINKAVNKRLPLFILGLSMGGSTALRAIQEQPNICDAIITDSSFSNLSDVVYESFKLKSGLPVFPFVPCLKFMVNFLASCNINKLDLVDVVKKTNKPIFFIHSCVDKIVSPKNSVLMYAASSSENKKLWIAPECRHTNLRKEFLQDYKRKICKFLKQVRI